MSRFEKACHSAAQCQLSEEPEPDKDSFCDLDDLLPHAAACKVHA